MSNNSSTGGYLVPASSPAPLEGDPLYDFIQEIVVGITEMNGTLVKPRYQPEPPNIPAAATAWCALGIYDRRSDTFPYVAHIPGSGLSGGLDRLQRNEMLDVLCSFYDLGSGGLADSLASKLRDGLAIAQNREVLQLNGWGLGYTGDLVPVPSLLKERWLYRVDLKFELRRMIVREYPVLNIESAPGTISSDQVDVAFDFDVHD